MLSSVLRSRRTVCVNIETMRVSSGCAKCSPHKPILLARTLRFRQNTTSNPGSSSAELRRAEVQHTTDSEAENAGPQDQFVDAR